MAKTGAHLKLQRFGDSVMGVRLKGNPKLPEPIHFRVYFPGGDVDITRCDDGDYWIHTSVNHAGHSSFNRTAPEGRIVDGRVDVLGKHATECSCGDLNHKDAYHVAVRVKS